MQRVLDYWTAERMAEAIPMARVVDRTIGDVSQKLQEVERGTPTVVPPTTVGSTVTGLLDSSSSGQEWTGGGAVTKTAGRVFFTFQGQEASCSGNAVTSQNKSVVMTAGHCVKYQGSWHTNWIFVPGYDHGERPHGTFTARELLTTPQWETSEDINYDVGAAVVNPVDGQRLTEVVGGQGIAFNQDRTQLMYSFGYPAGSPYDGESLIYCSGQTRNDPLFSNDIGLTCDMTGGSSGGPWFASFDESTGTGIQQSVNSFKYTFDPTTMYGPYFGQDAEELYQRAQAA